MLLTLSQSAALQGASINATAYNSTEALAIINQSLAYVNEINQSSYLIFFPNLKSAYAYLGKAKEIYNKTPDIAVVYAYKADEIARYEYAEISKYRLVSFAVMVAMTAVIAAWLYHIMKPLGKSKAKRRK